MLALGGFMSRPFPKLQEELREMKAFVENWPFSAQRQILKRMCKETSSTKGAITGDWNGFLGMICFWPRPGIQQGAKMGSVEPRVQPR